ncbi:MAG TPA: hypothetical protein VHI98_15730 [Vicinamibacterales bacterium]|jgi:hypothetical protein|nr:hypothetical protein [Vicinamibacterales bacterium]HEX2460638.1 hypothetical protein [Vicinamibacterales bacterium]
MKRNKLLVAGAAALSVLGLASTAVIVLGQEEEATEAAREHVTPLSQLGPAATATDVWSLQCGLGTSRARADVLDLGGVDGRRFIVTLTDSHGRAVSRTGNDGGASSLDILLSSGPGNYLVYVSKTSAGTFENYNSIVHCETSIGGAVAHNIMLVQNQ